MRIGFKEEVSMHTRQLDSVRGALIVVPFLALGACAVQPAHEAAPAADAKAVPLFGPAYLQLDGTGTARADEFMPPEHERYLAILEESLESSGLFADVTVASGRATPRNALVVDVHLDAAIDAEHSSSKAAYLLILPVRTEGTVRGSFELRRADTVFATFEYEDNVVTHAVPAAELVGRTWIEKSGSLTRMADQFAGDLSQLEVHGVVASRYVAQRAR
jgi:hypothetical protein